MSKKAINNLAVHTSIRAVALNRFIRKYNLDIDKLSQAVINIRKDLSFPLFLYLKWYSQYPS